MNPDSSSSLRPVSRAWYHAGVSEFRDASVDSVIGALVAANTQPTEPNQVQAWQEQISTLQVVLKGLRGHIFFEFDIPRMGRRIDVILITGALVFVIEFKVGSKVFEKSAINQVWDYALDLKNFHETSHSLRLVPLLVATEATQAMSQQVSFASDGVAHPICVLNHEIRPIVDRLVVEIPGPDIEGESWYRGAYRPTPTIIEAARALYADHRVEDIARHDAGATNLRVTSRCVEQLIDNARANQEKVICFVTGVPGAGKTLVGLNIATRRSETSPAHAVFLSGNGPLVAVLRAALTRDDRERRRLAGKKISGSREANPVKSFIQNVHHFRDTALVECDKPPIDHVAIFDEAQRAWNLQKTADFMKRRKGQPDFNWSEPAFLISYMDRHADWAAIVCLVGGGQEIHTGEAGIAEWLDAISERFPHWHLYISSQLTDSEYVAGRALQKAAASPRSHLEPHLHLAVSMRSFRAENVSCFVKAMLDREEQAARIALGKLKDRYPIVITRSLDSAKKWVREHARGSERIGLLASSRAMRLKPYAIDVRVEADPVNWFLGDPDDIRSSQYLEDVATEFQVQGLELDWAIVNWDGDLRVSGDDWAYHDFRGRKWQSVRKPEQQSYLKNAYRVLLTRARQGMAIFVPAGEPNDHTRPPAFYDPIYGYLRALGLECMD